MDVTMVNGKAYVSSAVYGLSVVNVSTPSVPTLQGSSDVPFTGEKIAVSGNRAVVTGQTPEGMAHLWMLNLNPTNPAGPFVTGELASTIAVGVDSGFLDVALNSTATMAVVAVGTQGIWVVDLTNPSLPRHIFTYDTPGTACGVALNSTGTLAYVADGTQGLRIISVGLSAAPALVGYKTFTAQIIRDVAVNGGIACLVNQQGKLNVVDVSNPNDPNDPPASITPQILGFSGLLGYCFNVAVSGTRAAVLSTPAGSTDALLEIFDISVPTNPVRIGSASIGASGDGLYLDNTYVYVAAGSAGLKIYDNDASLSLIYTVPVPGDAYDVAVNGIYAYITGYPATISIVDLFTQ